MQFKEALRAAGLEKPGRTTWCGIATDGVPVFTIWANETRWVNGRVFAWWDHDGKRNDSGSLSPHRLGRALRFIQLAQANIGKPCRAVLLHPRIIDHHVEGVDYAEYPHPAMGTVVFRATYVDALQFIAELLPSEVPLGTGVSNW